MSSPAIGGKLGRRSIALVLAATVLSLGGCQFFGTGGRETDAASGSGTGPGVGQGVATTSALPPSSTEPTVLPVSRKLGLRVYYVYREKVQPVYRSVPGTTSVVRAAVTALLTGPTAAERAKGLSSQVPADTRLRGVSLRNGVAYVDLTSRFGSGGGSLSMLLRLAQLTFTATQFPSVTGVVLKMNGKVVDVFSGEGIELAGAPKTRSDYEDSAPAILVEVPSWGASEPQPAFFKGTANVFEARFTLQLFAPDGSLLASRRITASSGTGTRGTWSAAAHYKIPKSGWGKVRVFSASQATGKPENLVTVPVYLVR